MRNATFAIGLHNHVSSYLVQLVAGGILEVQRPGRRELMRREDIFSLTPYEVHAISAKVPCDLVTLVLPAKFLAENTLGCVLAKARRVIEKLPDIFDMPGSFWRILYQVVFLYHRRSLDGSQDEIELAVRDYIDHPEARAPLAALAAKAGFDKCYYLRLFKRKTGLTPHRFRIQNRIRKARRLLEQNVPEVEAALQMGFYDQSHFIHMFKKFTGISPAEYKKSLAAGLAGSREKFGE